ncbi:DUF4262 domain-containing protein [Deinococcus aestuarii]|uniref:DUF4262 domain-containing protein n=1 Tax=Deinococcus aestuarii TaxID=2774531 RepID=UPI001C0E31B3|nr:DUF4262 domain-containing protein [Deinococcus aestuarii]
MAFTFPAPENDFDRRLIDGIRTHGWYVLKVPADEEGPSFAFTVGLWANYGHPEIIMVGLDLDLMHLVLNIAGDEVKTGHQRFEDGRQYRNSWRATIALLSESRRSISKEYLGTAMWLYRQQPFAALQCVWPDKQGLYPWQNGFNPEWRDLQPVLNTP